MASIASSAAEEHYQAGKAAEAEQSSPGAGDSAAPPPEAEGDEEMAGEGPDENMPLNRQARIGPAQGQKAAKESAPTQPPLTVDHPFVKAVLSAAGAAKASFLADTG